MWEIERVVQEAHMMKVVHRTGYLCLCLPDPWFSSRDRLPRLHANQVSIGLCVFYTNTSGGTPCLLTLSSMFLPVLSAPAVRRPTVHLLAFFVPSHSSPLFQTGVLSSPPRYGKLFARLWGPRPTCHQVTTHKPMARQNKLIRTWGQPFVVLPLVTWLPGPPTSPGWNMPKTDAAVPSVKGHLRHARQVWHEAQSALTRTAARNQRLADRHRTPAPDYQPGQRVWLSSLEPFGFVVYFLWSLSLSPFCSLSCKACMWQGEWLASLSL